MSGNYYSRAQAGLTVSSVTAASIARDLAIWSRRWPKGGSATMSAHKLNECYRELSRIEERAKQLYPS